MRRAADYVAAFRKQLARITAEETYTQEIINTGRFVDALKVNLLALIDALNKAKPAGSKGIYLKKVSVSSTMGVGVRVDQSSLQQQPQA